MHPSQLVPPCVPPSQSCPPVCTPFPVSATHVHPAPSHVPPVCTPLLVGAPLCAPLVMNQLINPSHGGAYMVEGRLLLGLDWLVVGSEPCLLCTFITSPRIVPVRCIVLSHVSRASGLPLPLSLLSLLSHAVVFHSSRLHGTTYPMTDLLYLWTYNPVC